MNLAHQAARRTVDVLVHVIEVSRVAFAFQVIPEAHNASESAILRNAMELAALTSVSHPNIVQVNIRFTFAIYSIPNLLV